MEKLFDYTVGGRSSLYDSVRVLIGDAQNTTVTVERVDKITDEGSGMIVIKGKTTAIIPRDRIVAIIPGERDN